MNRFKTFLERLTDVLVVVVTVLVVSLCLAFTWFVILGQLANDGTELVLKLFLCPFISIFVFLALYIFIFIVWYLFQNRWK